MNWQIRTVLAGALAALGLYVMVNPVRVTTLVAGVILATMAMAGTWTMLRAEHRLLSPVAHWRLARWSLSFVFTAVPVMVVAALPGHHPRELVDPAGLQHWLDHLDPATSTVPAWALP